ncbi:hypothetical protein CROQUDRAFT_656323 [Cronartium quercuum f. sp. fusiforme G11]|uniref:cDENN domain-containing protein n=1 Tax=Cronartium quercuum f. sp. fusiforme G11 TaxID=708437 RepID=A0A9P6TDY5_9BASI|nr:hypothetical protein CROQUDRAFT_656323 [Cronartium quercuum f. sp. fusiforme G11]
MAFLTSTSDQLTAVRRQPSLPTPDDALTNNRAPQELATPTTSGLGIALPSLLKPPLEPGGLPKSPSGLERSQSSARSPQLRNPAAPTSRISGAQASEASYRTESERSTSRPTTFTELPSLLPPIPRPAFVSTTSRTTDSHYTSAESSLHHFPTISSPPPHLPPITDWANSRPKPGMSISTVPLARTPSARQRTLGHELSHTTLESMPSILPSPTAVVNPSSSELTTPMPSASGHRPETRTLASLYMVCGLPKDPSCWTLAQPEHLPAHLDGAVPRFWRPEVLGTTLSGQDADLLTSELDKRRGSRASRATISTATRPTSPVTGRTGDVPIHSSEHGLGKEELARVQAKAMKLAFSREVEVIASTVQPASTTHCFSFDVPAQTSAVTDATGAIGQQWDLAVAGATGGGTTGRPKTYYGACLQVWSHADRARSEAIRRAVEEGSKAKSAAIARAVKAAAAGKRFGARLERATKSAMGALPTPDGLAGRNWTGYTSTGGETDTDTEGFVSESEWDGPASMLPVANLPGGTPFWLPYCLVLLSRMPIYDLMADHLRISWARYHQAIGKHSQQMLKMLNFPCPKPGERVKMPVGGSQTSSPSTFFVAKIPGKTDLMNGGLEEVDFTMWPVFKSLSLSHIVSIYELALSPMGRVVFFSRYPAMLNMAVETFRVLLELRGWQGLCQSVVHARDVKIYLEDPGPFLLGMNSQLRPIVASGTPPEIMIVDIDTDNIICQKPHPQAFSKGNVRLKIERRLEEVLGTLGGVRGVPSEFHEAFPGGRFRPFSAVEIKDTPSEAERLLPPAEWNWDQTKAVIAFDQILSKVPRTGFAKVFRRRAYRQAAQLDSSAQHVQEIVRKHTTGFVDRRDMLETKIWKLNRRLAFLMAESMEWKQHFDIFQKFADKLSVESQDLKTRLEVERRDHHKLSGVVSEQKHKQAELESRLLETEQAWMAAQVELAKAHDVREELERQKQIMVSEMKSIALADNEDDLVEKIVPRVESCYTPWRASTIMSDQDSLTSRNLHRLSVQSEASRQASPHSQARASPTGAENRRLSPQPTDRDSPQYMDRTSPQDMHRASPQFFCRGSITPQRHVSPQNGFRPLDELSEFDTDSEANSGISGIDERAQLSRTAVIETMRSIQGRLEAALRTAGQLDEEELKSYDVGGGGRKANSRMSAESRDSKIIPLRRGRRKPTMNESDVMSPTHSTPSPEHLAGGEIFAHQQSESLSRTGSAHSNGVPLVRSARNDPRMSAVSLLRPGSSIFGDRNSFSGTETTTPSATVDYGKLETVMDGNELEELDETSGDGHDQGNRRFFSQSPSPSMRSNASLNRSENEEGKSLKKNPSLRRMMTNSPNLRQMMNSPSPSLRRVSTRLGSETGRGPVSASPGLSLDSRAACLTPSPTPYKHYHQQNHHRQPHRYRRSERRQDTEDGSSSPSADDDEEDEDEEEDEDPDDEEERFLSAAEEEEGLSELGGPGRSVRRKSSRLISEMSRASMVGMPVVGGRLVVRQPREDYDADERVTYRGSFMSHDSGSTVRQGPTVGAGRRKI